MEQGYAVAAFNLVDYGTTKAMIKAAEELQAPVIVQVSTKTIKFYSHEEIFGWVEGLAKKSPSPIVLHLDHCKDLEVIRKCAETGWTSVMIDASELPFEQNLALSRQAYDIATAHGIGLEAEIGQILGVEGRHGGRGARIAPDRPGRGRALLQGNGPGRLPPPPSAAPTATTRASPRSPST
ncbi:MAG: class II fructose-bisphosphate aldolase [Caulobacteraceae bacterium]